MRALRLGCDVLDGGKRYYSVGLGRHIRWAKHQIVAIENRDWKCLIETAEVKTGTHAVAAMVACRAPGMNESDSAFNCFFQPGSYLGVNQFPDRIERSKPNNVVMFPDVFCIPQALKFNY